ncbi:MAG TPA: hypothetical protein VGM56_24495 [Byssovorax sp.]
MAEALDAGTDAGARGSTWITRVGPLLSPIVTFAVVAVAVPCLALPPTVPISRARPGLRDAADLAVRGAGTMTAESLFASLGRAEADLQRERTDVAALRVAIADGAARETSAQSQLERLAESERGVRAQLANATASVAAGAATEARLQQSILSAQKESAAAREEAKDAKAKLTEAQLALRRASACEENAAKKDVDLKSCRNDLEACRSAARQGGGRLPVPPAGDRGTNAPPP